MAAPDRRAGLNLGTKAAEAKAGSAGIHQLAPEVAEAIAAGEVIERPASVVKELVENSLDAGASHIFVEVAGGGAERIKVVDDGAGMSPAELALCFQRHATSKIRTIEDLSRISTFGFRGEALASIAAVGRLAVASRTAGSEAGTRVEVSGREQSPGRPVGVAVGTTIEVRDLFHNTPARRAFLRSARAEASACLRVVSEAALGRPDVRFEFRVGGRRALGSPGGGDLREAARAVLGRGAADHLLPVDRTADEITVIGVLGMPAVAHPNRNALILMVNGRRVHQRALVAAVEGAYRGLLAQGRHPLAVLDIRCDPAEVDVNVHPTKREVRFREEGRFFEATQRACWEALRNLTPGTFTLPRAEAQVVGRVTDRGLSDLGSYPDDQLFSARTSLNEAFPARDDPGPLANADRWTYLGQAHNRYLVLETERGIALLDQHAAHEKVIYARVLSEMTGGEELRFRPGQGLLTPMLLEVGAEALTALPAAADLLQRAGFELEPFGEGTLRCSAVPVGTRLSELRDLLLEVLVETAQGPEAAGLRLHRVAASVACHSAVRFGDPMSREQVLALLRDLTSTPGGITCPHGRPSVLILGEGQLLSAFHRR
ncbi:MAG: DNA mismatch repair endonuclease MutL [Candidatus Dormibacteria bacterium]